MSSSVRHGESRWRDFVCLLRSRSKGGLVLVRLVRGIKQVGLRPFGTKLCEWRACPCSSGTRIQSGKTSSVRYEVTRKESLSYSDGCEESSRQDFVCPVQSCVKGGLVLVRPVQGIKQAALRPSSTKSLGRRIVLVYPVQGIT